MAKKVRTMQGKIIDFDQIKRNNKNAVTMDVKVLDKANKLAKKVNKPVAPVNMHTLAPKRSLPDIGKLDQKIRNTVPGRFVEPLSNTDTTNNDETESVDYSESEVVPSKAPKGRK